MVQEATTDSDRLRWIVERHTRPRFEQLTADWRALRARGDDLVGMLNDIGIDTTQLDVPRLNTSVHKQPHDYVRKGSFLHKVLSRRYRNDARLFKLVESGYFKSEKRVSAHRHR